MEKVTFRDCWARQTYYLSLMMIIAVASKVITQFLITHYSNNLAAKIVIVCFKAPFNVDFNLALLFMVVPFLMFASIEYTSKKLTEHLNGQL